MCLKVLNYNTQFNCVVVKNKCKLGKRFKFTRKNEKSTKNLLAEMKMAILCS